MADVAAPTLRSKTLATLKSKDVDLRRDFKEMLHTRLFLDLKISSELGHEKPPAKLVEIAEKITDRYSKDTEPSLFVKPGADKALEIAKMFQLPLNDNLKNYVRSCIANTLFTSVVFDGSGNSDDPFTDAKEYAVLYGLGISELGKIEIDVAEKCFQHGFYAAAARLAERNEMVELKGRADALKELLGGKGET